MLIKNFSARNFYSFKDVELDFESLNGIVRIVGKNKDSGGSNGSGKSSIFEAVCWGLFGKTIRQSSEEALVNNLTGKDCSVSIEIFKENVGNVKITRTKRPTSLILEVEGKNCNKENALETQKYIEELLETDYKSFLASVIFGQHSDTSFLDSSPEEKRNIIRNCFNLEDIFAKRNSVKEIKSNLTGQIKASNSLLESLRKEKAGIQIPDKKYKYVELPSLEEILQKEKEVLSIKSTIKDLQESIRKFSDKISKVKAQLDIGEVCETKECPVCKSPYVKVQSSNDIVKLEFELKSLTSQKEFDESQLSNLQDKFKSSIPQISSLEWSKYNEKNKLFQDAQNILDKVTSLDQKIESTEMSLKKLNEELEVMKFWELAFSEKGIVRYIVRNILEYLNLRSNEYLSILTNNQFSIEFNDELAERIRNNGSEVKYISLSGGEKRKVNLAIMLSLQDLSSKLSKTNCNLLFFDEVCDSLDKEGVIGVSNLLKLISSSDQKKVVLVISHNYHLNELLSEFKEIIVNKKDGISFI